MSYPNPCNRCEKDCPYTLCAEYQKYIRWWWKRFKVIFHQPVQDRNQEKFIYAHPDQVRRYLEEGPCKGCRIKDTCDTACKAYARWWDARMEIVRKKVGV